MKQSYEIQPIQETIKWAIQIYIEEHGRVTPTEVLRFAKFEENNAMRSLVLELAKEMEYTVKSSGKGYIITDTPIETMPLKEYEIAYRVSDKFYPYGTGNIILFFDVWAKTAEEAMDIFWSDSDINRAQDDGYGIRDAKVTVIGS